MLIEIVTESFQTVIDDVTLPTFKSQVEDDVPYLPQATATVLGTVHRAQIQAIVRQQAPSTVFPSRSSGTSPVNSLSVEEEMQLKEKLRKEAHEALLRFEQAERKLRELQTAKRERDSILFAMTLPQPKRQSLMDREVAQQLTQIWENEDMEQATMEEADHDMAERLQSQETSALNELSKKQQPQQRAPRRRQFQELAANRMTTRRTEPKRRKAHRTLESNRNEELWI